MAEFTINNRFTGAALYAGGGTLRDVVVAAVKSGANLSGAYLSSADLYGADLRGSNLSGAYLSGSDLRGSNLRGSNLSGSDLSDADLRGSNLSGSNLSGADLSDADLSGSNLSGSNLRDADLSGSNLRGNKLVGSSPVLQIGPIGSRADYLVAYLTDAGVMIAAGCFFGTLDEFRAACDKTHGDSIHGREYAAAIQMIKAHALLWTPAEAKEAA